MATVERYSSVRDLGVILSDDGRFETHIKKVIKKSDKKQAGYFDHSIQEELM